MEMEDYLIRFLEIENELEKHPKVALMNFYLNETGYREQIDVEAEKLPFPLPKSVKDFYYHVDTLQLRWMYKGSPDYEPEMYDFRESYFDPTYVWDDELVITGCINILSFKDVFFHNWMETDFKKQFKVQKKVRFLGKEMDGEDFYSRLFPFDFFNWNHAAAFYFDQDTEDLLVLIAFDQFADFQHSVITDFESYLEMILHKRGLISARWKYYSLSSGERRIKTPQNFWTKRDLPKLDDLPEMEW